MSSQENIEYRLAQLEREIKRMGDVLTTVRDRVISTPICPMPGKCIEIDARVEAFEERLIRIEKWQSWIIGVGATLIFFSNIIGDKLSKLFLN